MCYSTLNHPREQRSLSGDPDAAKTRTREGGAPDLFVVVGRGTSNLLIRNPIHFYLPHWRVGLAGAGRGLCRIFKFSDVDAGLGFGDGAVVDLDLGGFALDEDARGGFAVGGDADTLGDGAQVGTVAGADEDRDIGGGIARVGQVDGDQPVARRGCGGEDALDAQVGQALVGIDPIGEEPGEVGWYSVASRSFSKGLAVQAETPSA